MPLAMQSVVPHTANSLNRLTADVISAGMRVHRVLGPGLLENAYLACLAYELKVSSVPFELQKALPLIYKCVRIDCASRADLIVDGVVLIEVKALETVAHVHKRQLRTYAQLADCRVGLLLNFGAPTLKDGIVRIVNRFPE